MRRCWKAGFYKLNQSRVEVLMEMSQLFLQENCAQCHTLLLRTHLRSDKTFSESRPGQLPRLDSPHPVTLYFSPFPVQGNKTAAFLTAALSTASLQPECQLRTAAYAAF